MTRAQRTWHLRIWLTAAPVIAAVLFMAAKVRAERARRLEAAMAPVCCRAPLADLESQP